MAWRGLVWCGVAWCGAVQCGLTLIWISSMVACSSMGVSQVWFDSHSDLTWMETGLSSAARLEFACSSMEVHSGQPAVAAICVACPGALQATATLGDQPGSGRLQEINLAPGDRQEINLVKREYGRLIRRRESMVRPSCSVHSDAPTIEHIAP